MIAEVFSLAIAGVAVVLMGVLVRRRLSEALSRPGSKDFERMIVARRIEGTNDAYGAILRDAHDFGLARARRAFTWALRAAIFGAVFSTASFAASWWAAVIRGHEGAGLPLLSLGLAVLPSAFGATFVYESRRAQGELMRHIDQLHDYQLRLRREELTEKMLTLTGTDQGLHDRTAARIALLMATAATHDSELRPPAAYVMPDPPLPSPSGDAHDHGPVIELPSDAEQDAPVDRPSGD